MALRDYLTAADGHRYDHQAQGTLRMDVTHSNLIQRWHDIKFDEDMTIGQVKEKLYRHGGTPAAHQELYLRRGGSDTIFLMDEYKTLRYYGAKNGMEIHVKDTDPHSISLHGGLEDVSQVQKYEMEDDVYDKLQNSVRACKRKEMAALAAKRAQEKAAREAAGEVEPEEPEKPEESKEEVQARMTLGSRCEVAPGGRRGEVAYIGYVLGLKGVWVGVKLDEPLGMNDGTKDGKIYFDCKGPKYGCFAKADKVELGDFPERDPFASDDEF